HLLPAVCLDSHCVALRNPAAAITELWNHAGTDPVRATEALIKLEAREARMLGLDMPTRVSVTDPDGGIPLETIRRVMERVDRQMVDVTPVPAPLPLDHKRQ